MNLQARGSEKTIGIDARLWDETGVGRYIRNLIQQLQTLDTNHRYVLFVGNKDYEVIINQGLRPNWKVVRADIQWHTIEEQVKFTQILYKEKLDLMHFPYFSFPFLYRRPFVITIHDLILHHFPTGQATTLPKFMYNAKLLGYKFLLQSGANRAEKIITVSNATKQEIVKHLHIQENKVAVTYEGIDEKIKNYESPNGTSTAKVLSSLKGRFGEAALRIMDKKNQEDNYFLYVGNAYPHKNLERLINAFVQFKKNNNTEVKLLLVGKEDFFYKRLKKKVGELNVTSSIIFKYNVSDQELSFLYQHTIALVIPSLMEGFGLPAVEAMANHCLVLASDIPSLREICQNAAVYVDPNNTEDIAEKLIKVYKDKKAFEKNKSIGLERSKLFSWEKMAKETIQIYESCISV